jgi:hypothetical protein
MQNQRGSLINCLEVQATFFTASHVIILRDTKMMPKKFTYFSLHFAVSGVEIKI